MWQPPKALSLVAGHGEGGSELNAFDRALRDAGVADLNFIRVTSIVPPGARLIDLPSYPPGILLPAVFARIASTRPGDVITAALGVGLSRERHGVVMEYSGHVGRGDAEEAARQMVVEGFAMRGLPLDDVIVVAAEHIVERAGSAVAVALFWPEAEGLSPRERPARASRETVAAAGHSRAAKSGAGGRPR